MNKPRSLALEELAWPEVGQALEAGYRRVVFALGATEQHGPHLPLLVDAEIGADLCSRIASALGETLFAPTVRIGCSEHHMHFSGTLTLRRGTLEAIVTDYVTSLTRHGFTEILIVPSHGGNFAPLEEMLPRLQEAARDLSRGTPTQVRAFTDLAGLVATWKEAIADAGGPSDRVGGHADIAESSIMQTLTPLLVNERAAEIGYMGEITNDAFSTIIEEGLQTVSANGILGDARGMTPELGTACQEAVCRMIVHSFTQASRDAVA